MVLGPLTYATFLGRRYVQVGQRRMPLFIEATEQTRTRVSLTLPPGWVLEQPLPEAKVEGPFGAFVRSERQVGARMEVTESYRLDMARIPVARYEAFAQRHVPGIDHAHGRWSRAWLDAAHPISSYLLRPYTVMYGYLGCASPDAGLWRPLSCAWHTVCLLHSGPVPEEN